MSETITPGASGEEILRQMLPLVLQSLTKSAEGQTLGASAIQQMEVQIQEVKTALQDVRGELRRIADSEEAARKQRDENGKWMRAVFKPETVLYLVVLLFSLMGIRMTIPAPLQNPLTTFEQPSQLGE